MAIAPTGLGFWKEAADDSAALHVALEGVERGTPPPEGAVEAAVVDKALAVGSGLADPWRRIDDESHAEGGEELLATPREEKHDSRSR